MCNTHNSFRCTVFGVDGARKLAYYAEKAGEWQNSRASENEKSRGEKQLQKIDTLAKSARRENNSNK